MAKILKHTRPYFGVRSVFLLSSALCLALSPIGAVSAGAQSVSVDQLGAAQSYDRGPLNAGSGGLDANLWQGVSAQRAAAQIKAASAGELSELPYLFLRRVLLSEGVPPQGDSEAEAAYVQAAARAKLQLGDYAALDNLSGGQNPLQRDPEFRVNLALASGDIDDACAQSDREIDNRTAPFWMQMRIICHIKRDEVAAAELTLNLMRDNDEADENFIGLAEHVLGLRAKPPKNIPSGQPLLSALKALSGGESAAKTSADYVKIALSDEASPDTRLDALFKSGRGLRAEQVKSIMSALQFENADLAGAGGSFDIESALAGLERSATRTQSVAQLYALAGNFNDGASSSAAAAALLKFSESVDFLPQMTELLSDNLPFIPAERQAELDAKRFAWAAVRRTDLSALGGLYGALGAEHPLSSSIALASDALGNGFAFGQLGRDIEGRLAETGRPRNQAVRDALIGLALGALLSDDAAELLQDYGRSDRINPVEAARLNSAANAGARASTLLYVIEAMGAREVSKLSNLEIYTYIAALSKAGLTREAGELAAYDFLSRSAAP